MILLCIDVYHCHPDELCPTRREYLLEIAAAKIIQDREISERSKLK